MNNMIYCSVNSKSNYFVGKLMMNKYPYAHQRPDRRSILRGREEAKDLSTSRLNPSLQNPDYLIYIKRREYIETLIATQKNKISNVVDVGGRIQPYKFLFSPETRYWGIDPIFEGLVGIVGLGEYLPVRTNSCDFVMCTQTLSYVNDTSKFISEIYRVLKSDAPAFISVPAFFPQHHDEHWRFLPQGLEIKITICTG